MNLKNLALGAAILTGLALSAPYAKADDHGDWHGGGDHGDWHGGDDGGWHHHDDDDHDRWRPHGPGYGYYYAPPPAYYAPPPPVYYAPPPVYYAPPPPALVITPGGVGIVP